MKNKYIDLIEQSFDFPTEEFSVVDNELTWFVIPLMEIIKQYGTPLRLSYLPRIGHNIQRARRMFNVAMAKVDYNAEYHYAYCTKSSHFSFIMEEVLKHDAEIEISSAFDINIIESLYESGHLKKDKFIICNGFKRPQYAERQKAADVAKNVESGIIIGSDTIVWQDGCVMGKPCDRAAARAMLRQIQGNTHSVFTGVTLIIKENGQEICHTFHKETKVHVYPMTEEETERYIDTGEPMDKAGAYGIQGAFAAYVEGITGDYNSVVGLPVSALWQVLKQYMLT